MYIELDLLKDVAAFLEQQETTTVNIIEFIDMIKSELNKQQIVKAVMELIRHEDNK